MICGYPPDNPRCDGLTLFSATAQQTGNQQAATYYYATATVYLQRSPAKYINRQPADYLATGLVYLFIYLETSTLRRKHW